MSAATPRAARAPGSRVAVLAGLAVLALRPFAGAAPQSRTLLFAVASLAIGLAALLVPVAPDRPRVHPALVLAFGLGALAAATAAAGAPVPVSWPAAALPLSVLAAVAEEALFRRVLFARLLRLGVATAIAGSAVAFALVHLPAYGTAVLPVDLGAGILFGWQRWASGTWMVPATTHAVANAMVVLG